jgi:hypothetical protein
MDVNRIAASENVAVFSREILEDDISSFQTGVRNAMNDDRRGPLTICQATGFARRQRAAEHAVRVCSPKEDPMTIRSFFAALILTTLGAGGIPASAIAADETRSSSEVAQLGMEQLRERLALTPDQEAKIAPLVQARNQKLQALRGSMDADASRRQKRGAFKEAREIQSDFVEKVEPLLTAEQKKEWEALRKEMRDEMKQRVRNR